MTARGGPRVRAVVLAALLVAVGSLASACGVIGKIRHAVHDVEANLQTVDTFTQNLQASPSGPFAVTYATTGSAPVTVVYAVNPAAHEVAFQETPSGGGTSTQLISNVSGDYACTQSGPGAAWSCDRLSSSDAANSQQVFDVYTPAHWVDFLKGLSVVAGLEGGKVTTSTMAVHGFDLQCLNLVLKNVNGTTVICTTSQGLLGYVQAPQDSTSFEITNYTSSPPPSLFALPAGATVTTVTAP